MFLRQGSRALGPWQDLRLRLFFLYLSRTPLRYSGGAGAREETMEDFRDSVNATEMVLTPIFRRLRQTSACKVEFSWSLRHSSSLSGVVLVVV